MGRSIYWYGGGYYAYYPGGPLMLGTAGMPGYADAYGYNPGYDSGVVVTQSSGLGTLFWILIFAFLVVGFIFFLNVVADF